MKQKLFTLFVALVATTALWAQNNVITYTATKKLFETTYIGFGTGFHTKAFNVAIISHDFSNGEGTITFAGEVTTIGDYAFQFCSGLTSVTIPNSVTTIGNRAFYKCSSLTSITIPNSVTTIGEDVFWDCYGLTSVTIPSSATTIGFGAFWNVNNIVYNGTATGSPWGAKCANGYVDGYLVYSDATKTTLCGCSSAAAGEIIIPNSVTTIGEWAFYQCSDLMSVTIPNSVTTIEYGAFEGCSGLTSVTIPNSVTTIENAIFYGCSGLTSVTIPNSVSTIGAWTFRSCYSLTSVTIPNSVETIDERAFSGCSGLTFIAIPDSVTTIGVNAFSECSGLTSITIPNTVTDIGYSAFYNVSNIVYNGTAKGSPWDAKCVNGYVDGYLVYSDASKTKLCGCSTIATGEIIIPNSVTTIGDQAFEGCSGLTSIIIPNSVTTIEDYAFADCTGLISMIIPNSVTTIGEDAFADVQNVTYYGTATGSPWGAKCVNGYVDGYLVYSDASKTILLGCSTAAKGEVIIPNSVTTIEYGAFEGCSGLTSITIPNSVTTIEGEAFANCFNLSYIDFGCGLEDIGNYAFESCHIDTAVIYSTTPPSCVRNDGYMGGGTFTGLLNHYAVLFVPKDCESAYKLDNGWKDFDIHVLEANVVPSVVDVTVTPSDNAVQVTWPITDDASTYTITISKNGEVVCVLTFNANGQLTNIAFAAPGHNGAHQAPAATLTAQGYQFTVTGLNPGTTYDYSVTATDAGGQTLAEHKGNFSTTGGTGFETVHGSQCTMHKYFHNGNLIIERNGIKYTPTGQKVL